MSALEEETAEDDAEEEVEEVEEVEEDECESDTDVSTQLPSMFSYPPAQMTQETPSWHSSQLGMQAKHSSCSVL